MSKRRIKEPIASSELTPKGMEKIEELKGVFWPMLELGLLD